MTIAILGTQTIIILSGFVRSTETVGVSMFAVGAQDTSPDIRQSRWWLTGNGWSATHNPEFGTGIVMRIMGTIVHTTPEGFAITAHRLE